MIITLLRTYKKDHTDGRVFVNGDIFGHSLEDAGRPPGVKIAAETCIPEGAYYVRITHSNKFKRDMILIFNIVDDLSVDRMGVRFTGIRVHGGNNIEHTAGCIMVARNSDKEGNISGSLENELYDAVLAARDRGEKIMWVITEHA